MSNIQKDIFTSPYRMQVLTALKESVRVILSNSVPVPLERAVEVGCGTGFFYQHLAPQYLKDVLIGVDRHKPSLDIFHQISPEAQIRLGNSSRLDFTDNSLKLLIGFSAYPMLTQTGVLEDFLRTLQPGGRLIAFQDSFIKGPWEDQTVYEKMERVEYHHQLLLQNLSRGSWKVVDGVDPVEVALAVDAAELEQRIAPDIKQKIPENKKVIATVSDTGLFKVQTSIPEVAGEKFNQLREELGNPRSLQEINPDFSCKAVEFVRMRYLVAEKNG